MSPMYVCCIRVFSSPDRPKLGRLVELNTSTHVRVTEVRARVRQTVSCSLNPLGLFCSNGSLSDQFKGVLLNAHIYLYMRTCVKSVIHGNLKPFAESAQVVRRRARAICIRFRKQ